MSSYLLHFDSKGGGETVLSGKVVLPEPVVGVISSGSKLDASDKKLGVSTVTYPEQGLGKYRTINLSQADAMSVSSDRQTVQVNLHNWKGIDQMRILTASQ